MFGSASLSLSFICNTTLSSCSNSKSIWPKEWRDLNLKPAGANGAKVTHVVEKISSLIYMKQSNYCWKIKLQFGMALCFYGFQPSIYLSFCEHWCCSISWLNSTQPSSHLSVSCSRKKNILNLSCALHLGTKVSGDCCNMTFSQLS